MIHSLDSSRVWFIRQPELPGGYKPGSSSIVISSSLSFAEFAHVSPAPAGTFSVEK